MKPQQKYIISFFCILFLTGCHSSWSQPLPNGEIVYMAVQDIGFIQAENGNALIHEIDERFAKPVWSNDSKLLYGLSGHGSAGAYGGHPAYWDLDKGQYKICTENLPFFYQIQGSGSPSNPYEVIIQHVWEIIVMDLSTCKNVLTVVDYSDDPGKYAIAGFSYFPPTQELVYGLVVNPSKNQEYKLLKLNLKSGKEVQIAEGINPSWSPDGSQIAFLNLDGLHVVDSLGDEIRHLVNRPFFPVIATGGGWDLIPIPRWSPDGEWLIYHRCDTDQLCKTEDAKIYKIRSSGGLEEMIIAGGEYPSWGNR